MSSLFAAFLAIHEADLVNPCRLERDLLDLADPVIRIKLILGKGRDHLEHSVGETSNIQYIRALDGLRGRVRLDVDADAFSVDLAERTA